MLNNWITHPVTLTGETVVLIPLESHHFDKLYEVAQDRRIWEFFPVDLSDRQKFDKHFLDALAAREKGDCYPFIATHKLTGKFIGSTFLFDIHPADRNLEIGWTWLHPEEWRSHTNFECKLLLLTYCFDRLKCIRVQLKTSHFNYRSQNAIKKLGAKFEGILRNVKIQDNGIIRSSVYFSILDTEWPGSRELIDRQIAERKAKNIIG